MIGVRARADLALVLLSFIWGATFVVVKSAIDDVSTMLFLTLRFALAALALWLLYLIRKGWRGEGYWRASIITGAALFFGYLLQTMGLHYTTPAKSGFVTGLYIVLVPIFSAAIYRRKPELSEWAGVLLATAGLGMMTLDGSSMQMSYGDLLTAGCAVLFAFHILLLEYNSRRMSAEWLAFTQIAAGAGFGVLMVPWIEPVFLRWTPAAVNGIIVTALLATAVGFWLQTWAQKHTSATRAALIFALEPVFAWLTSFWFLGERLTDRVLAGAICILAGILLVEIKPLARRVQKIS